MPLYLVRWPGLPASLITARSEVELIDIIDEVASPSECRWWIYRGPVWIDFTMRARYSIRVDRRGRVRVDDVEVTRGLSSGDDKVFDCAPGAGETAEAMTTAILTRSFPRTATAREREVRAGEMRSEIARDIADHASSTMSHGVTFDSSGVLLPTRRRALRRTAPGRFVSLSLERLEDFALGLARIRPEADGYVRVVEVDIVHDEGVSTASLRTALQLRTTADGRIHPAHRADVADNVEGTMSLELLDRRNEVVRWQVAPDDASAVAIALGLGSGRLVSLDLRAR